MIFQFTMWLILSGSGRNVFHIYLNIEGPSGKISQFLFATTCKLIHPCLPFLRRYMLLHLQYLPMHPAIIEQEANPLTPSWERHMSATGLIKASGL